MTLAPEAPRPSVDSTPESQKPPKNNRKRKMIIAGSIGLSLAVGGGAAALAINQAPKAEPVAEASTEPNAETQPEDSVDTNENPSYGERDLTLEDMIIPTGLDTETLGRTIVEDRLSRIFNAGGTKDLMDEMLEKNLTWEELYPEIVEKNKQVFAEAMFVQGYENTPLNDQVNAISRINSRTLQWFGATAWNQDTEPRNVEPYRSWNEFVSAQEIDDGDGNDLTRTVEVTSTTRDNSDKNTATPQEGKDDEVKLTFSLEAVDGKEVITQIK